MNSAFNMSRFQICAKIMNTKGWLLLQTFFLINCICKKVLCDGETCPDPLELEPYCVCNSWEVGVADLDCSKVKNQDELELVFTNTSFPYKNISRFSISYNEDLRYLTRNVFGDISFEVVYFLNTVLEYIDGSVFIGSASTLERMDIENSNLAPQGFFFSSLDKYHFLRTLFLQTAGTFDVIPNILSISLHSLGLRNCSIRYLPDQVFAGTPNLESIKLEVNRLTSESLPPDIFKQNPLLVEVYLDFNEISVIQSGTFKDLMSLSMVFFSSNKISQIESGAFSNLPSLDALSLEDNELTILANGSLEGLPSLKVLEIQDNSLKFIDPDMIKGLPSLQKVLADYNNLTSIGAGTFDVLKFGSLHLNSNHLTTLQEDWLLTVLKNNNYVFLQDNPLECGCDMAWLYDDTFLLYKLDASCSNGTDIHDLDPSYFINNC